MKQSSVIWIVVAVVIVIAGVLVWMSYQGSSQVAPYGSTTGAPSGTTQAPQTPSTGSLAPLTLNTGVSATLGTYLVASNGMTLYEYAKDTAGVSNCSGACATNWPPYAPAAAGSLAGGTGVTGAIATLTRADGSLQVTYNGHPLYFWGKDAKPGDTLGQGVLGAWSVVKP